MCQTKSLSFLNALRITLEGTVVSVFLLTSKDTLKMRFTPRAVEARGKAAWQGGVGAGATQRQLAGQGRPCRGTREEGFLEPLTQLHARLPSFAPAFQLAFPPLAPVRRHAEARRHEKEDRRDGGWVVVEGAQ